MCVYFSILIFEMGSMRDGLTVVHEMIASEYIVTDLINAFPGSSSVNTGNVQQWKICIGGRILLLVTRQQRTNEDAG
jgi:hypothetical protein